MAEFREIEVFDPIRPCNIVKSTPCKALDVCFLCCRNIFTGNVHICSKDNLSGSSTVL